MFQKIKFLYFQFKQDSLLRGTVIVAFLNLSGGIFGFLAQSYLGRNLTKNEFGLVNTIFSASLLVSIFLSAHRYWIIQSYNIKKDNLLGKLKTLYHHLLFMLSIVVCLGIFVFFLEDQIYLWFKFNSLTILWLFLISNLISFISSPLSAYFQATESFLIYGMGIFISSSFKFLFVSFFLFQGLSSENAYLSFVLSGFLALLFFGFSLIKKVSFRQLINAFHLKTTHAIGHHRNELKAFLQYFSSAFIFTALFNIDIVLIRYLLPPEVSGDYAGASLIGKAIYFLSAVIVQVFYPLTVKVKDHKEKLYNILNRGLFLTFLIGGLGFSTIYVLTPTINTHFFLGKFDNSIHLINMYSLFSFIMVINSVYIHFFIAIKKFLFVFILLIFPIIQLFLITYTADRAIDVVTINNGVAICLLALFVFNHLSKFLNIGSD